MRRATDRSQEDHHQHDHHQRDSHPRIDRGALYDDVARLLASGADRRQSMRWLLAGAASLGGIGCGGGTGAAGTTAAVSSSSSSSSSSSAGSASATSAGSASGAVCSIIPEETGGPYPADGSNGSNGSSAVTNALVMSGIVRSDIRASVAAGVAVAQGVLLTIRLKVVNVAASCASAAGATVYLWHCDRDGNYSLYASSLTGENDLRGVQEADSDGVVTFTTIFPGCYAGRVPHVHLEVYPSLGRATVASNRIKTTQFTFPDATLAEAYGASGYATSARNLANANLATDNVFADGVTLQTASMTGSAATGFVATLQVGVSL